MMTDWYEKSIKTLQLNGKGERTQEAYTRAVRMLVEQGARLDAGIASTGGCNVFGLDWCNFLFGTSGDIKRKFEQTALTQLQGSTIQNALRASLAEALAGFGVTGTINTVTTQGDQIVITTI